MSFKQFPHSFIWSLFQHVSCLAFLKFILIKHVKHNCQNLLQNTLIEISFKKLNKPIRMQTASITTLNTNFRSMTTSIEIQPTLQANWAPSTSTLRTLDHLGEVQVTVI